MAREWGEERDMLLRRVGGEEGKAREVMAAVRTIG